MEEKIGLRAQNLLTTLDITINIIKGTYTNQLVTQEYLYFDIGQNIHISFENYKESGYKHNIDLLIFHTSCAFHILREVGVRR